MRRRCISGVTLAALLIAGLAGVLAPSALMQGPGCEHGDAPAAMHDCCPHPIVVVLECHDMPGCAEMSACFRPAADPVYAATPKFLMDGHQAGPLLPAGTNLPQFAASIRRNIESASPPVPLPVLQLKEDLRV